MLRKLVVALRDIKEAMDKTPANERLNVILVDIEYTSFIFQTANHPKFSKNAQIKKLIKEITMLNGLEAFDPYGSESLTDVSTIDSNNAQPDVKVLVKLSNLWEQPTSQPAHAKANVTDECKVSKTP